MEFNDILKQLAVTALDLNTRSPGSSQPAWSSWAIYMNNPKLVDRLAPTLAAKIKNSSFTFDFICGIPDAGVPLASAVSRVLGNGLVRFLWGSSAFKLPVPLDSRILLVDTVAKSGETIGEAVTILKKAGCRCVGAALLAYYDDFSETRDSRFLSMQKRGEILYLATVRQLEKFASAYSV